MNALDLSGCAGGAPGLMGKSQFADYRGVSPAAITKAIKSGRLTGAALTEEGKINVLEADRQLESSESGTEQLTAARVATEKLRQQRMQFELDKEQGRFVDAAAVQTEYFTMARKVRDSMTALPGKAKGHISALCNGADPTEIESYLSELIRDALTELANDIHIGDEGGS